MIMLFCFRVTKVNLLFLHYHYFPVQNFLHQILVIYSYFVCVYDIEKGAVSVVDVTWFKCIPARISIQ